VHVSTKLTQLERSEAKESSCASFAQHARTDAMHTRHFVRTSLLKALRRNGSGRHAFSLHCCSSDGLLCRIHRSCCIALQLLLHECLRKNGVRLRLGTYENLSFCLHLICGAVSANVQSTKQERNAPIAVVSLPTPDLTEDVAA